ncbi:MAG: ParB/RepB/Spo0J family partition protein [Desulfovibrio sp.]|nr:ParB/RepB/Spo0J family partition protein [Desulfovibrio sp.]
MSAQSKLGRGLDALLEANFEHQEEVVTEIPLGQLKPNPWQPRRTFSDESLKELAASIKNQGIIQPLLVRQLPDKSYQIIAGERRFRAAKIANLTTIPVFVRAMSDSDVMAVALIENLQREDLNPIEEAQALKTLRDELNITQEVLAAKLGRSRSYVTNSLRLLQLSTQAQENLKDGLLSAGHARCLLGLDDGEIAEEFRKFIINEQLSVRQTEEIISNWKNTGAVPWKIGDEPTVKPNEKEKKPRTKQSEIAQKMQSIIEKIMPGKTKVQGNEEKGRITLCYSTSEELQEILEKLGAEALTSDSLEIQNVI